MQPQVAENRFHQGMQRFHCVEDVFAFKSYETVSTTKLHKPGENSVIPGSTHIPLWLCRKVTIHFLSIQICSSCLTWRSWPLVSRQDMMSMFGLFTNLVYVFGAQWPGHCYKVLQYLKAWVNAAVWLTVHGLSRTMSLYLNSPRIPSWELNGWLKYHAQGTSGLAQVSTCVFVAYILRKASLIPQQSCESSWAGSNNKLMPYAIPTLFVQCFMNTNPKQQADQELHISRETFTGSYTFIFDLLLIWL